MNDHDTQEPVSWGEAELASLRQSVGQSMSAKRLTHTLAVERMVARLAELYCPEYENLLRAAALLHDVTKEVDLAGQLSLCQRLGIPRERGDELAPKCFHAKTAAALIPERYPAFAHPLVVSAVRWHTTGHVGMTLTERLLYLADYIDDSRTFTDCVNLRNLFWGPAPEAMTPEQRLVHLRTVLITSYDMTMATLIAEGVPISPDTALARNELLYEQAASRQS